MNTPRTIALALLLVLLAVGVGQAQEQVPFLQLVGEWRSAEESPSVTRVVRSGSLAYATEQRVLHVLDVSDAARPTPRARVDLGDRYSIQAVAASGNTLLVLEQRAQHPSESPDPSQHQTTLRVFDTSEPSQPRQVGSYAVPDTYCSGFGALGEVAIVGQRAYLAIGPQLTSAACDGSFTILDLTSPAAPTVLGSLTGFGPAGEIRVVGSTAYVAESGKLVNRFGREYGRLRIVDVADPAQPREVGALQSSIALLPGLALIGRYAYLSGGNTCFGGASCHLGGAVEVVDVVDPARPTRVGTIETAYGADLETAGRYLFLAELRTVAYPFERVGCLRILDAADPLRPTEVAATGVMQQDYDLALDAAHVYVADGDAVRVFSWTGPPPTPVPVPTAGTHRVLLPHVATPFGCGAG